MRLWAKFNVWLLFVFLACFLVQMALMYVALFSMARKHTLDNARIMMGSADAIRAYTATELSALLPSERNGQFVPETVPAHAAQWNLKRLQKSMPAFSYREPTLNPTNPQHRASDWEADIIEAFRSDPAKREIISERETPTGKMLVLAKPLTVSDDMCLTCHGTATSAPGALLKSYGSANGFGWQLGDTIGAQVVTVSMTVPLTAAWNAFLGFLLGAVAIAAILTFILNVLLNKLVVSPVKRMIKIADAASLGDDSVGEYVKPGKDEMSALSVSFSRMRQSLKLAMEMVEGNPADRANVRSMPTLARPASDRPSRRSSA